MKNISFAILFIAFTASSCKKMFVPEPANNPEAIFEHLWNAYNEDYAPFEERNVDWDRAYDKYRPLVKSSTTEKELFKVLSEMMSLTKDAHVWLTAPVYGHYNANKYYGERFEDELFNLENIRINYLKSGYKNDHHSRYTYGMLKNENIGYIHLASVGDNFLKLENLLDEFSGASSYIIDLRHNGGGDFTWAFKAMGRLTQKDEYAFRSKTKNGKGKDDYTPWFDWYLKPNGTYVGKPVVVLTDRYTVSAAERATMAFKKLPNIMVMGDTTNGSISTLIGRELANGWAYSIGSQKIEMFDGINYEGKGIPPDVFFKNNMADVNAGIDRVLEKAIERLKH